MPLIEAGFKQYNGLPDPNQLLIHGPTIWASVGPYKMPPNLHEMRVAKTLALIDTGAGQSMIDYELATSLDLIAIDKTVISGAGGPKEHLVYMGAISIPELGISQFGKFTGANLKAGGILQHVLLGRDFLAKTIMIYDGVRSQVTIMSAGNSYSTQSVPQYTKQPTHTTNIP